MPHVDSHDLLLHHEEDASRNPEQGMKTRAVLVVAGLVLAGVTSAARTEEERAIAVLDLKARGLEASVAENITELVLKEIDRVGMFRTISTEEIKRMLSAAIKSLEKRLK